MQTNCPIKSLPTPPKQLLEHSNKLIKIIQNSLLKNNNLLSFNQYMNLALYHPVYGYYSSNLPKFGNSGDFVTAPLISSLFGKTIANCFIANNINNNLSILEFGAGSGKLCLDILQQLESQNNLPNKYYILELSPYLIQQQQQLLQRLPDNIYKKITWLNKLPSNKLDVFVIANEVLDAMPINLFQYDHKNNKLLEKYVRLDTDTYHFEFCLQPPSRLLNDFYHNYLQNIIPGQNYSSECNLYLNQWLEDIIKIINTGYILLIDYGFTNNIYYHPDRNNGTLMCHYKHYAHTDPFIYPGLQDITAHVDFSIVIDFVTKNNHLEIEYFDNQANFLMDNDILSLLEKININSKEYLEKSQELKKLIFPHEMGELFKVIMLKKN